uniref:ATP-dependent Clp protease proteolytic subunit n=1 Tax=Passiflora deidamioides TaxID=340641 RepID=A0A7H0TX86_9ROSI|nr:ClpP [Passiflora deidamioides]QNR05638.1 ClpP [Passiflora deidamioides]
MPLGVPQIPLYLPQEEDDDVTWIDNGLYKIKILFLGGEVNSELSTHISNLLIHLNAEDYSPGDFYLFINSPGGWILPGMTIYNTMDAVDADVRTICTGLAASMASFILVAGASFKRFAFPHAWVMIHQPHGHFSPDDDDDDNDDNDDDDDGDDVGTDDDDDGDGVDTDDDDIQFFMEMEELLVIQENIVKIYAEKTGQPLETILADLDRDFFMSATEAQAHGIVDSIGRSKS